MDGVECGGVYMKNEAADRTSCRAQPRGGSG